MANKESEFLKGAKSPKESREWFRDTMKGMTPEKFQKDAGPFSRMENLSNNSIGRMYTFTYDAKWKDTLKYWDMYPLIFPIDFKTDSMLAINLHYLHPSLRVKLLAALMETANNNKLDKTTKLKINYGILKAASQYKPFKPCLKKYLFSHVRSPFINVSPSEWFYTILLPIANFQKESEQTVWLQSALMIK
jgi:hypothetical protein